MFLKNVSILRNYLMNLWTVTEKADLLSQMFLCITKKPQPKPWRNWGEKRFTSDSSFYPNSSFEQFSSQGGNRTVITILSR